ncbi:MAG: IclR family transcriptional regulator [Pseudomonadota bacterium]
MTVSHDAPSVDEERYLVPGLIRGLNILRAFSDDQSEMGVAEIARQVDVGRSTAFRLVYTLEYCGFLQKVPGSKKYRLGTKVLELGFRFLSELDIIEISRPHLQKLRDETEASAHLAILDGKEIVYVARHNARTRVTSNVGVGTRFPAHATSSGRVLLSGLPITDVVNLYEDAALEAYTTSTATSLGDLINQLSNDRQAGYVLSWGAFEENLASIAAPVFDSSGSMIASINISCPMTAYARDVFETDVLANVIACGEAVSRSIGYAPPGSARD